MKQSVVTEPGATVIVTEGEISSNQPYELDIAVPEGATHALMLIERLAGGGHIQVNLSGLTANQLGELSALEQVRMRFLRMASNTQNIALRVSTAAKGLFRVTVAFVKRETASMRKNFKCRTCKQLCRLAISAMLAHLGIPYLDAGAAVDAPVPVGDGCRAMLEHPAKAPPWLREMFDLIDVKAMAAVRGALEVVDGLFDATDRLYTLTCQHLHMCPRQPQSA